MFPTGGFRISRCSSIHPRKFKGAAIAISSDLLGKDIITRMNQVDSGQIWITTFVSYQLNKMDLELNGKNALVAGSSQGIGKAIAIGLAGQGAKVTVLARNEEKLKAVLAELPAKANQKHELLVADFSDTDGLNRIIHEHLGNGNIYQILINNTGGPPGGPISEAETDEFQSAFNQHLIANHMLTQAVWPGMKQSGYGRIVNIISTSVKVPLNGLGVSNTVRGAVANWAKTMANELGAFGITVNNVLPGATSTGRLDAIVSNKAQKLGVTEKEVTLNMAKAIPLQRFGKPEEIANAAVFLCSPAASYINGINLPVDGGRTPSL